MTPPKVTQLSATAIFPLLLFHTIRVSENQIFDCIPGKLTTHDRFIVLTSFVNKITKFVQSPQEMENSIESPLSFNSDIKVVDSIEFYDNSSPYFLKSLEISPDGKQILVASENDTSSVITLPSKTLSDNLYYKNVDINDNLNEKFEIKTSVDVGESIFDQKWFEYSLSSI